VKNRQLEADLLSAQVLNGSFQPSVDILIPTYDEPVLFCDIIGCQAIDHIKKVIYSMILGVRNETTGIRVRLWYITRQDNQYAKQGINHAVSLTNSELIVVFDADFVPTKNFLIRTAGIFFKMKKVALVQTPKSFYNIDPIARNGLGKCANAGRRSIYRQIQPLRDSAGSLFWNFFVLRRSA